MLASFPKIFLISWLLITIICLKGVQVNRVLSSSTFKCFVQNGVAFTYFYGINNETVANLQAARAIGLITELQFLPCRSKNATAQVNQIFNSVSSSLFGKIWIDVETNPQPGCGWSGDNCAYVTEIVNAIKAHGKIAGIFTNQYMWTTIMGGKGNCPSLASQQLMYPHYDNNPSFSDFIPFGGWTKPSSKMYGEGTLCGASVQYIYAA